jgi:PTH1 family peptidyl-tRNA hydrolase
MKLIVGLGNPGNFYSRNRHNIGFMCVTHLAKEIGASFDKKEGLARTAHGVIGETQVVLARPQTYMNASGEAVSRLLHKYRLNPDELIVIHDDMDLKAGQVRLRRGGSSAGHKGVASVISDSGVGFIRVKVGIGRPDEEDGGEDAVVDYVLSDFLPAEAVLLESAVCQVTQAVMTLVNEGLEAAMNRFNRTAPPKVKAEKPAAQLEDNSVSQP